MKDVRDWIKGFEEAQAPFGLAPGGLAAIHRAYGHRCAFTGVSLQAEAQADPLAWLLILDKSRGTAPGNLIPAAVDAIWAYEQGHLAIGPRYEFLVALDVISPEFLETLNPIGRLTLPDDPAYLPDPHALKAHRDAFAAGLIDLHRDP